MTPIAPSLWHLIEAIAVAMAQRYGLARSRALCHPAPMTRMLAQRDHLFSEAALLERELAIFRAQRLAKAPRRRPQFGPGQRAEILQLTTLRGWTAKQAADRFGLHPNTIRNWRKALRDRSRSEQLFAEPPWNRLHTAVRWTVHEIRRLCPEREFGTRTIARHMIRAGIQISRTSIRRILEEEQAKTDHRQRVTLRASPPNSDASLQHLMNPRIPHAVWHIDLTELRVLWRRFEVAAVLDSFSRKLLALRVFDRRPTSEDLIQLVDRVVKDEGTSPRFVIIDHGAQFRKQFSRACEQWEATHVRGKVGVWQLNSKVERIFRTVKSWQRRTWMAPRCQSVQTRLDAFQLWYNEFRPHAGLDGCTPAEKVRAASHSVPVRYAQKGGVIPEIRVNRQSIRGDPRLYKLVIQIRERRIAA